MSNNKTRRYACDFAVGDKVEFATDTNKRGVVIHEIDFDPPSSRWLFIVLFDDGATYGMSKGGVLYDTRTGVDTGTAVRKLRKFNQFYVLLQPDGQVIASKAEPVSALPVALLRWYEDGRVEQITREDA